MAVGISAAALELTGREIKKAHEMIDDAMELIVCDKAGEARIDLEVVDSIDVFERRQGDCGEPDLCPGQGRDDEEGQELPTENLVADRFVEQDSRRKTGSLSFLLIQNPLGLEQQGLAEPFGADDDELIVPIRTQESVDFGGAMQQRLVEVVRDADIVGVNGPCAHAISGIRVLGRAKLTLRCRLGPVKNGREAICSLICPSVVRRRGSCRIHQPWKRFHTASSPLAESAWYSANCAPVAQA